MVNDKHNVEIDWCYRHSSYNLYAANFSRRKKLLLLLKILKSLPLYSIPIVAIINRQGEI